MLEFRITNSIVNILEITMGKKRKKISIPEEVVNKIQYDYQNNGITIFKIKDTPDIFISKNLIHPDVLQKSTSIITGFSSSLDDGKNYMFLVAARLDEEKGKYVTDLDPIVMVSDINTQKPGEIGIVRFHGNFVGRGKIECIVENDFQKTVLDLRNEITGSQIEFEKAPDRLKNAMHYMANEYKNFIGSKF
jgi:hypothetical protein